MVSIKFRDISSGIVEARAIIEISEGVFLNEVTIVRKNNQIMVELPQKSFKGKGGKLHFLDVITFENDNKKTLWMMEIREAFIEWRKRNKKVLVYNPEETSG